MLGLKITDRGASKFHPEQLTDWLRNCYTEATALVDENGVIEGKAVELSNQSLPEQLDEAKRKLAVMETLMESSRIISSFSLSEVNDHADRINIDYNFYLASF